MEPSNNCFRNLLRTIIILFCASTFILITIGFFYSLTASPIYHNVNCTVGCQLDKVVWVYTYLNNGTYCKNRAPESLFYLCKSVIICSYYDNCNNTMIPKERNNKPNLSTIFYIGSCLCVITSIFLYLLIRRLYNYKFSLLNINSEYEEL
jgi:hypothetical protein